MENKRQIVRSETLPVHTEENLMGIPVILKDAAVVESDAAGDETVTIPDMDALVAAIAVNRCLEPGKLAGAEIRFMRKALWINDAGGIRRYCRLKSTRRRFPAGRTMGRCWADLLRNACAILCATRFAPNFHISTTTRSSSRT